MFFPNEFISVFMLFSKLSNTVNTEIIEKIPIVMPRSDNIVRTLLTFNEFIANTKLSLINFNNNITCFFYEITLFFVSKKVIAEKEKFLYKILLFCKSN